MTREDEMSTIDKVLEGDIDSFSDLVRAYEGKIYNLCLRMTGSREDARDLTQEAFVKAYKKLDTFKGDSSFYLWLYRIASNTSLDFLRRERKREKDSLTYEDESGSVLEMEIPDQRYSPEMIMDQESLKKSIEGGLMALRPAYRNILIMREMGGLSYKEIADTLGITEGTVKSRISRARGQLVKYLSAEGNFSDKKSSDKQAEKEEVVSDDGLL